MNVVTQKYRMKPEEAKLFVNFILPMLHCYPEHRATAQESLNFEWLYHSSKIDRMDEEEFKEF